MEDTFQEGQEKEEEEPDKKNIEEEDNAIEMSEDFDGQMHDGDQQEPGGTTDLFNAQPRGSMNFHLGHVH